MTYCLGIVTEDGLAIASDSRTNAGYDQILERDQYSFNIHLLLGGQVKGDQDLQLIHASWEQSLRRAVEQLPEIEFRSPPSAVCA